ncbi:class I SAM-dependent methyltransferase [Chelativorans sp. AA-79]|uniref:class I SAM-dependent methyltransferase n=1 Tax=Chelativorans sp. AA-79 TaxID=3028735 RepID=UPI0023F90E8B|nr:class I SAM-dependent methyltransferase [Chelativorans sp. AA-79]WEX10682.1 class I SAM-dependent methyltransferase [Chelativorans sp. AA-79]
MAGQNWTIKDEIRDYWSGRAASFDLSPGHEIFAEDERHAWHALIEKHLGAGAGRDALDLASGTGVISRLLCERGYSVTGLDFSEPMLERAEAKAKAHGLDARYVMGDAENTLLADAAYDVIMTRHLVWTLPDPAAAFADWFRVLKPGGRVLIVDADMAARTLRSRLLRKAAAVLKRFADTADRPGVDKERHNRIVAQVHFSGGARAEDVAALLRDAGFQNIAIDRGFSPIRRAQGRHMPLHQRIDRASQDRYAIQASKPVQQAVQAPGDSLRAA